MRNILFTFLLAAAILLLPTACAPAQASPVPTTIPIPTELPTDMVEVIWVTGEGSVYRPAQHVADAVKVKNTGTNVVSVSVVDTSTPPQLLWGVDAVTINPGEETTLSFDVANSPAFGEKVAMNALLTVTGVETKTQTITSGATFKPMGIAEWLLPQGFEVCSGQVVADAVEVTGWDFTTLVSFYGSVKTAEGGDMPIHIGGSMGYTPNTVTRVEMTVLDGAIPGTYQGLYQVVNFGGTLPDETDLYEIATFQIGTITILPADAPACKK